jgi:drug/metabolite transporter (DMT)-like permease
VSQAGASAGLGLLSAASWGGSDFVGGVGARRAPALLVVASGQVFTLAVLLAICMAMHLTIPAPRFLVYSALGGLEGALALALFYRALAAGAMGLTAALAGLLTALVPVVYALFHDGLPAPPALAGLAAGLGAIWLITHSSSTTGAAARAPLWMGALAGLGFGAQLILFKMGSAGGAMWAMTSMRVSGVAALLLVIAVRPPGGPWHGFWVTGLAAGVLDTAGNGLYIWAAQLGRLEAAALICSLYPGVTILLAALVLRERPTKRQVAGMALALAAVALLSV